MARQAIDEGWNKRTASDVITFCSLKSGMNTPSRDAEMGLGRDFTAKAPNTKSVADITGVWSAQG
jgi:hypothetical protein